MEAGQLFCGCCYGESYEATCGGCGSKIGGDQLWVEALDQQWHSHCFTCTVSECVLFLCVCSTVCIVRHLCVWIVDHVAHAIILYLERMCRVSLLELSDKQVDSNTVQHTKT